MAVLTTSGTYNGWSQSAVQLITSALRLCQVVGEDETPTGFQLESGLDAMNAMLLGWSASGIHVWAETEAIIFCQPSQYLYQLGGTSTDAVAPFNSTVLTTLAAPVAMGGNAATLTSTAGVNAGDTIGFNISGAPNYVTTVSAVAGDVVTITGTMPVAAPSGTVVFDYPIAMPRPLRVYGGRRFLLSSQQDTPMIEMARLDYQNQPAKTSTGIITQYFFDPQTAGKSVGAYASNNATALVYLWPSPQDNTYAFRFSAQRPMQDISNLANLPDLPREWNAAIKWNLAVELAPEYGVPSQTDTMQVITSRAGYWFNLVSSWDKEPQSILFGVATRPGYRR
jgi:hypothetical protein